MRIVYFYQYFGTTKGGWSTRVYEMARRWVQKGHRVVVVTSLYDKSDLRPKGFVTHLDVEGITVILINIRLSNKHGLFTRALSFLGYALVSAYFAIRLNYDVCIASSGPITVGLSGLAAKVLRRRAFIFEIRDIWPEGAIQLGILRNALAIAAARWLERTCYRAADMIVACSPGQAEHVVHIAPSKAVLVIPNASDNDLRARVAGQRLDLPDALQNKRLVLYTGTLGLIDDCAQIVEAARVLQERGRTDIAIVLIGDGNERTELEERAAAHALTNLHFLGLMPKERVALWLEIARASLLTIKPLPVLDAASPNKIFDAFALGVPIIQNSQGWIRALVEEEKCGLNVPPDDPAAMAAAVERLCDDDPLHDICAANALRLARTRFDRGRLAQNYLDALQRISSSSRKVGDVSHHRS